MVNVILLFISTEVLLSTAFTKKPKSKRLIKSELKGEKKSEIKYILRVPLEGTVFPHPLVPIPLRLFLFSERAMTNTLTVFISMVPEKLNNTFV